MRVPNVFEKDPNIMPECFLWLPKLKGLISKANGRRMQVQTEEPRFFWL